MAQEEQRLSIDSSTSVVSSDVVLISLLAKMSLVTYWALHPSLAVTSSLGVAALTIHAGVTQGSNPVSLSMRAKHLPVVDLTHLQTILDTILPSWLLLF